MRVQKITGAAIAAVVLVSGMVFIQCSDGAAESTEFRAVRTQFAQAEKETPEMQAKRAEFYQRGIERVKRMASEGKMEQARADFALKSMASTKDFLDANPEWTKYFFAGKNFDGGKDGKCGDTKGDKKFEGKKFDGKKFEAPKMDSAELKANWEAMYQRHVDRISQKAGEGKMEQDRADFLLKWMAHDKAFKDANPEWSEFGSFMGRGFGGFGKGFGGGGKKAE